MKKLTAMLLALCMLLAAVPALGEDLSGNWYMTLADVSLGYFILNEDGTAQLSIAGQDEITGTWTADDETSVTIVAEGSPATFTYDGTSLKSDLIPLGLTREEGKLPMDVISAMMAGEEYELPEGMTEMDLMTIAVNFVSEYTKLMEDTNTSSGSTGSTVATTEPAEPAKDPEVTVLKENFLVIRSYNGFRATYIAKVQNENDIPLFLTDGSLIVKDAAGTQIGEAKYLYPCGSKYLEPGEITFIGMQADLEGEDFTDITWEKDIEVKQKSYSNPDISVQLADPVYVKGESEYDSDLMKVTVINDSDQPVPGIEVILVLEDAEGNLLYAGTESLYRYELGPNSTINLVTSVDNKVRDYCTENGIEPAAVEAFAWVEN